MKCLKKLTRTQRGILTKLGYVDVANIRYLTERGDNVVFIGKDGEEILVDKATYYKMK